VELRNRPGGGTTEQRAARSDSEVAMGDDAHNVVSGQISGGFVVQAAYATVTSVSLLIAVTL
jgi:hypothetical protein